MNSMQVKDKLKNIAAKRNLDFNILLRLYMYDRFANVTPVSSPNINDLREFYDENQSNFTTH